MDTDFRQDAEKDSVCRVDGLDRAQERARACPDSRVVTVCDRKGDFWELIAGADQTGAALLVRASRGAKRRVALASGGREPVGSCAGNGTCGWSDDRGSDLRGTEPQEGPHGEADIALHAGGPACPEGPGDEPPVRMIAVSAREEDPPRRRPCRHRRQGRKTNSCTGCR